MLKAHHYALHLALVLNKGDRENNQEFRVVKERPHGLPVRRIPESRTYLFQDRLYRYLRMGVIQNNAVVEFIKFKFNFD